MEGAGQAGSGQTPSFRTPYQTMTCLLDTHFLLWIVSESKRLQAYPWLKHYEPWGVSPISFLEIQMLSEIGRRRVNFPRFTQDVMADPRFHVDEISVVNLIQRSL